MGFFNDIDSVTDYCKIKQKNDFENHISFACASFGSKQEDRPDIAYQNLPTPMLFKVVKSMIKTKCHDSKDVSFSLTICQFLFPSIAIRYDTFIGKSVRMKIFSSQMERY